MVDKSRAGVLRLGAAMITGALVVLVIACNAPKPFPGNVTADDYHIDFISVQHNGLTCEFAVGPYYVSAGRAMTFIGCQGVK